MKLKVVATRTIQSELLEALNGTPVADGFRDRVVIPHLHVDPADFGPSTHYVQELDLAIPTSDGKWGIEVTLSKVSVNENRSGRDFKNAMTAVVQMIVDLVEEHLFEDQGVDIYPVLALDEKVMINGQFKSLHDPPEPVHVRGKRKRKEE